MMKRTNRAAAAKTTVDLLHLVGGHVGGHREHDCLAVAVVAVEGDEVVWGGQELENFPALLTLLLRQG